MIWRNSTQQDEIPRRFLLAGSVSVLNKENHSSLKRWSPIISKQWSAQEASKEWTAHKQEEKPISPTRRCQYKQFSALPPSPHTPITTTHRKWEMKFSRQLRKVAWMKWRNSIQQNRSPKRCVLARLVGVLSKENHNSLKRWLSIISKWWSTQEASQQMGGP